jgi:hypothetical protein
LANCESLNFEVNRYIDEFGFDSGTSLHESLEKELAACTDKNITLETIRVGICVVIWKVFGCGWMEKFSSIQESRSLTPTNGAGFIVNLYA